MAVTFGDFLDFAKSLPEDREIDIRNSISRAYYAAYHACYPNYSHDRLAEGGVHNKLISALIKSPSAQDRRVGYILQQIKSLRTVADYSLTEAITVTDKRAAVKQTESLLAILPK